MAEDSEKLVIDIEVVNEEASKKLKEIQKEVAKLSTEQEKLAKIRSSIAKYSGKDKNATPQQKAINKEIREGLKLQKSFVKNQNNVVPPSLVEQQKKSIKQIAVEQNKTAKEVQNAYNKVDFNSNKSLKNVKKEEKQPKKKEKAVGFVSKESVNEQKSLIDGIAKEYKKTSKEIKNTYESAENEIKQLSTETKEFNKKDIVSKSNIEQQKNSIKEVVKEQNKATEEVQDALSKVDLNVTNSSQNKQTNLGDKITGNVTKQTKIFKKGEEKELQTISEEYNEAGNLIQKTFKQSKGGLRQLTKETEYFNKKKKETPQTTIGDVIDYDAKKHTLRTRQILENNKEITRSYENVEETVNGFKGVLTSEKYKQLKEPKKPQVKILEDVEGEVLKYDSVKHTLQTEQIIDNNKKIIRSYKNVQETVNGYKGSLESSSVVKNTNTSLSRIKRIFQSIIAFRLASSFINLFIGSFKEGIQLLKQAGGEISKPFVEFQQATMAIKVSLGTIVIPLIQTLTSILDPLSEKFVNLANVISYTNAVVKGQSEYYKLSTEKIDEYTKSLNQANKALTQLDKFATLNKQNSVVLGEMVSIDKNTEEGLANIINIEKIKEKMKPILDFIETLREGIRKVSLILEYLGTEQGKTWGQFAISLLALMNPITRIIAIFTSFKSLMSENNAGAKALAGTIIALAGAYATLAIVKAFSRSKAEGIAMSIMIGSMTTAGVVAVLGLSSSLEKYSNGTSTPPKQPTDLTEGQNTGLLERGEYNPVINLTVNSNIDGRKVAETTTTYMYNNFKKQNLI